MNCRKAKKKLSPYMDQVLGDKEKLELERHLEDCSSCAHILRQLEKMHSLVQKIPMEKLRPAFTRVFTIVFPRRKKLPGNDSSG